MSSSTVIPSSHEFASQFGLAHFLYKLYLDQKLSRKLSRCTALRNGDNLNCGDSSDKLSENGEKVTGQNGDDNRHSMASKNWFRNYYIAMDAFGCINDYVQYVCDVLKIYNISSLPLEADDDN